MKFLTLRSVILGLACVAMASSATAADITLGNAIDSVSPSGTGASGDPWVYAFSSNNLAWGTDTASRTDDTEAFVEFQGVGNLTSSGSGGTVFIYSSDGGLNDQVGEISITATGSVAIGGYLAVVNEEIGGDARRRQRAQKDQADEPGHP